MNLKGKSFLKLLDFTPEEIEYLLDLAAKLRSDNENLWRLINHMTKDDK